MNDRQRGKWAPWTVFEKKLSDGSKVFDLHFKLDRGNAYASNVVINCISEKDAFECADKMNAALAAHAVN